MTQNYEEAVNLYDRIMSTSKDANVRSQAEQNKQQVMDALYG
jgi:hypothetical protein